MAVLLLLFLIKLGESRRRKKITISFEYLRSYVTSNEFAFFQETHSSIGDEKK